MVNNEQLGIWKKIVSFCCELCSGNSVELWNKDVDKDDITVEEGGEGWNKDLDKDIMEEKDLISGLPDDILVSIISRTHIKVGVRTSLLSKRWRNLYKLLSSVDFSCEYLYHTKQPYDSSIFADQMLRFLQLHSGNLSVKSVCLNFIYFQPTPRDPFSSNLFSFSSHLLSYMRCLQYCWLTACNLLPTLKTRCASLQKLRLSSVKLLPGSVDCILSNCLCLHSLHFILCKFEFEKMEIGGDNLRLELLEVVGTNGLKKIELYASNLKTFEYHIRNYLAELIFDYVPQLQNVALETPDAYFGKKAMSYLCGLPYLKTLILNTPGDYCHVPVNMFWNLTLLDLRLQFNKETILFSVIKLLHCCPVLQEFILETELMIPSEGSEVEMQVVPYGPHKHLRSVDIIGFLGTKTEVEFVVHILKSATRLEEIFISHQGWRQFRPKWPKNMKKKHKNIVRQLKHYATMSQAQLIFQELFRRK